MLRCPICKEDLSKQDRTYKCTNNHSFDIAKQGYTNLLINQSSKIKGDTKEMLDARVFIQEKGIYQPLLKEIIKMIPKHKNILDIGCGIGYYTAHLKQDDNQVIGIDIAKDALKIASRTYKNVEFFVASNKELPIKDNSVDVVVNIFAPIYVEEALRVLEDGYIMVVSPNEQHLIELKEVVYDSIIKKNEERNDLELELIKEEDVVYNKILNNKELEQIFLMTPHYWTTTQEGKDRLSLTDSLEVTFDFNIKIYKAL